MRCLKSKCNSKLWMILAVALIIAIYCLRIINLDQDLPVWGIGNYQPKDEGVYVSMAISQMEYGTINPELPGATGVDFPMFLQEHIRTNLLGSLLQMGSFALFGDNYYGLRMAAVFVGLLNLLLLGVILLELRKRYGKGKTWELWSIIGLLLVMTLHFNYYLFSRTVEPSSLRMLFAQLTMLIWLKSKKRGFLCFALLGACITVSVFLVYITNIFLYLAVGLLLLLLWKKEGFKTFFKNCCGFALGIVALLLVADLYYFLAWGTSALENFFGAVGAFSGVKGYEIAGADGSLYATFRTVVKNVVRYFSANFFLYAPGLLAAVLLLLPLGLWQVLWKKDTTGFLILVIPFSFLLQTVFSEDFIWRKFMVVAPCVMCFIYWAALNREALEELLEAYRTWCGSLTGKARSFCARGILPAYIFLAIFAVLAFVWFRLYRTGDAGRLDIARTDRLLILFLGCLPVVLWGAWAAIAYFKKKKHFLRSSVVILGVATLALSGAMLWRHCWSQPTFTERDMMISLSQEHGLDGKYLVGDVAMGVTLYNDVKPLMGHYSDYGKALAENKDMRMIHYENVNGNLNEYFEKYLFSKAKDHTPVQTAVLPSTFQVNGTVRNFALYEAAAKTVPDDEAE